MSFTTSSRGGSQGLATTEHAHNMNLVGRCRTVMALALLIAAGPFPIAAEPLDSLAAVRSQFRLGAEIFLDPSYTREEIQMHFRRMKETGLTVARMFIIWDHIEREPGRWKFDLYDQAYDAAASNQMSILTTLCPEDPPGWAGQTPFYHHKQTLNTPELRTRAADYLRRVVTRYKDHPAQGPWSLANEPAGISGQFNPFGDWLRQKYGSVEQVNTRWFRPIKSFDNVPVPNVGAGWIDYAAAVDWKWFRIQQQTDQLAWVGSQVRLHDQRHPTHANPSALAYNMPAMGADLWSQKQVLDFAGTTLHASWQFDHYQPGDIDLGIAFSTDLLRSGSGGAP